MSNHEVPEPILNSPYAEPSRYWEIQEGEARELKTGRRPAVYFYRAPKAKPGDDESGMGGVPIELELVNRIRDRVKAWRNDGYPGVTRTTLELLGGHRPPNS